MEFAGLGGTKGYSRLALGAAPVIYAWPTLALDPTMALVAQWVGFTGLWYADLSHQRRMEYVDFVWALTARTDGL